MAILYTSSGHTSLPVKGSAAVKKEDRVVEQKAASKTEQKSEPKTVAAAEQSSASVSEPMEEPDSKEPTADVQQTYFSEDLVLSGTPRVSAAADDGAAPVTGWRKYGPLGAALSVALVIVLALGLMLQPQSGPMNNSGGVPTPPPRQETELSALQRELILLEKDVEAADPLQAKLAFPPIDFELVLNDANLQQQR